MFHTGPAAFRGFVVAEPMLSSSQEVIELSRLGAFVGITFVACAASACPARCAAVWEAAPVHVPASAIVVVGEFANEADRSPAEPNAELPAHAHRWWELRLRVSNPTTDPVAVFWTDSYLVLPAGRAVPLLSLTVGSLPSSVPPGSSIETRFRFEADLPSEATVGVSLIWRGCCQAESAQWTWRLVRSGPAVDAIPPQPRADELPWGWILVGGILAVGLIAILLQL